MVNAKLSNALRLLALFILLGVVVYIYILSRSDDVGALREKAAQISFSAMIIPLALSLTSYLLRFIRWRLILQQLGHCLPIKWDLICYLSGFALTMTPGKSGETIRSAFLLQARVPLHVSLSAFVLERGFDLLVVAILASLLFIQPTYSLLLFLSVLVLLALAAARLRYFDQRLTELESPAFLHRLLRIGLRASAALKPKAIASYAALGCAAWLAQGLGFYFIVQLITTGEFSKGFTHLGSGIQDISALSAISTYCAGLFIGAVSMIPGGIGVTEGSLAWLLQTQGLDQNSAILSALISRGCTLWLAVAIGCAALATIVKGANEQLPQRKKLKENRT